MAEGAYHHGNLREALIAEAVNHISEHGVDGLSLRAVARSLGVSHGAPARHFGSKGDLLAAVASEGYQKLKAAALEAAEAETEPMLKLRAMGRATIKWAKHNRAFFSAILNPDVNRFAGDELTASLHDYMGMIAHAYSEAQVAGWQPDKRLAALAIHGTATAIGAAILFSDYLNRHLFDDLEDDALIDEVLDLVIPLPK